MKEIHKKDPEMLHINIPVQNHISTVRPIMNWLGVFMLILFIHSCKPESEKAVQLASNMVKYVFVDPNGTKWFATDLGVSSFDGKTWTNYSSKDGLPKGLIHALESSTASTGFTLWLASDHGLAMANAQKDQISIGKIYAKENASAISNDSILSLHRDNFNILWIGTKSGLAGLKTSATWVPSNSYSYEMSHFPITGIASSASASGWNYFATLGGGIARNKSSVDGITGASTYETPWARLPSDSIFSVCVEASTGYQWFGTNQGIAYHQGTETKQNWTDYTTNDGLISNHVYSILQDQQGNLWFGTDAGVSKYDKTSFTNYTIKDGLADNQINSMALDSDGSIWFATANGVSHYNGTWVNYQMK